MKRLEKILFYRVELWLVLLILPLFLILLIVYGAMVRDIALNDNTYGIAGKLVNGLARLPEKIEEIITYEDPHSISAKMSLWRSSRDAGNAHSRFDGRSGFRYFYDKDSGVVQDYLLMSRYDGNKQLNVVELYDLDQQRLVYTWPLDESVFRTERFDNPFITFPNDKGIKLLAKHPLVERDGSLVLHASNSPLYYVTACGDIKWRNSEFAYHHSLEKDSGGNYWVPGLRRTRLETFDERFMDDHVVKVSIDGRVLYSKSVTEILIENDLINRMYVYDEYIKDPIHLNDVQPVTQDTEYWKIGDVFLSLGHMNMLILFRPATNKVIWWSQDAVMHQHDIDIVGNGRISVYNNNRTTRAVGDIVLGVNQLELYDLEDNTRNTPYSEAFKKYDIRTLNQGLHDYSSEGKVMIDETNYGRLLMFDLDGHMYWDYINRASDGRIFTTNWPRLVSSKDGESIASVVEHMVCN